MERENWSGSNPPTRITRDSHAPIKGSRGAEITAAAVFRRTLPAGVLLDRESAVVIGGRTNPFSLLPRVSR